MSTLKSNNENMTINADGASSEVKFQANGVEKASISATGAFTSTTIDATALTGNLPAIDGSSLTNLPAGGKVLQVVSSIKTDTSSMAGSTAWTDVPSLSVDITPSANSSKILIIANITLSHANHANPRMVRDSTPIGNGTAVSSRPGGFGYANAGANDGNSVSYNFLDSPNATTATTYKIQINNNNSSSTCFVNRTQNDGDGAWGGRSVSSIILMEIGA